jgi:hypothetical protein
MENFKGTKGKWVIGSTPSGKVKIQDGYGFSIANMTSTIDQENRLNALLISKAPEMLDIIEESVINLKILRDQIDFESKVNNRFEELEPVISNWIERQEKLIKEATEL